MSCGNLYCATCHNFKPLLIIIMNNGNQYFKNKIIFMSKNLHSSTCQILIMDDNQWCQHDIMNEVIMELHSSWKWIVLIELQLNCNELHRIYSEL
jgi:hypothetical protein